ncbi:MAG: hypothetical protein ABW167_14185 [Baekduia sp.]
MALAACGADDSGGPNTTDQAAATSSTQTAPARTTTSDSAELGIDTDNAATVASCRKSFKPFIAKLSKIQASTNGTPRFRTFATRVMELTTGLKGFDPLSDSNNCRTYVGRTAGAAFVEFASATGTWATCPTLSKCSAVDKAFIQARLTVGGWNTTQARDGFDTIPKSGT